MDLRPDQRTSGPAHTRHLERKEGELWRVALLFLTLLATGLAVNSWETIRGLPRQGFRLEAIPVGVMVLAVLFSLYVWKKRSEIDELRGFVRAMQERDQAPPSAQQLEQLAEVLARSQQGYRELIDSFNDLVFALSLEGEIRSVNRRFAEIFGVPFPQLVGHPLDEFLEEPSRSALMEGLARFRERPEWSGTVRARWRNTGATRFFECVLHPIMKEGRLAGVGGIARDVTQLRESETRFTELFETLHEGVYFTTPEGELLDANPALVEMLGYRSKNELLGVRVQDLYLNPGDRLPLLGELEEAGEARAREIALRRRDGGRVICLDTSTAIRDAVGRVVRYQGTLLDITRRREVEKRLFEEQEFARRVVECFPDSIVVLNPEGRYTYLSPRIQEQVGYAPQELVGRALDEHTHAEDRPRVWQLFQDLMAGRISYASVEYRTQHKNGAWRLFRASGSRLMDAEGRVAGVIASARDITELKQLEQQVIQSERLVAMGQMIAGVTHELNNPLTAILGMTDLLQERALDDLMRRQLSIAHQQARRAADIVQNLLLFARPPAPKKAALSMNDILRRTLQLEEHSFRKYGIHVEFLPDSSLPAVMGDASQLVQVFLNLLTNAVQATRETRESGSIRVRLGRKDDQVWVSVTDHGPGIRPDVLPRVFDPFFTTKRPGKGTGLGLSISMAIVKEHGGSIEAKSPPGEGATFTVYLPAMAPAALLSEGEAGKVAGPAPGAVRLDERTVLVVEDEISIREMILDGLSLRGLRVECVSSGEEALQRTRQRSFDLILCDLRMPGISGRQVYEQLRSRPDGSPQPFLFMTGDLADEDSLDFLKGGEVRAVHKPFRMADLVSAMSEAMSAGQPS